MNATKVIRRNLLVVWRAWRFSFFASVLTPVMFLSAMGFGLGSMVEEGRSFGGASFVDFFATGMLAASCMQAGVFNATYPIMSKMTWQRNYEAILATPLAVKDIYFGELMSISLSLTQMASAFFLVMALFGVFSSPLAIVAIPVAVLTGVGCASLVMALTATLVTDEAYTWLFRFVVTPLFLLSGTFFPIDQLPLWGKVIASLTPLYHGVELIRQVTIYDLEVSAVWHLSYLVVLLSVGAAIGIGKFEKRLVS